MSTCDSVSEWVSLARHSDERALQNLWQRFCPRLLRLARSKLPSALRRVGDEEDLALRAFESYVVGAGRGEFAGVRNRTSFWNTLALIVGRKAYSDIRAQMRLKRGGGHVRGESALLEDSRQTTFERIAQHQLSPSQVFENQEWFEGFLNNLADEELSRIVCYKCEGYSNPEISRLIGRSLATVERRLRLIRAKLLTMVHDS